MVSTTFFALLAQVLLIQAAFAQCGTSIDNNVVINSATNNLAGLAGLGLNAGLAGGVAGLALGNGLNNGLGLGAGLTNAVFGGPGYIDLAGLSAGGGSLPISCVSPIIPGGLTVLSDNAIDGTVVVTGQLPFLSAAAFEGPLATDGSGAATCGCGNGNIGIVSESGPSILPAARIGLGPSGLANRGLSL